MVAKVFEDFDNFEAQDEEVIRLERQKALKLRRSQWWKNQKGRGVCYYCKEKFHPSQLTMDHIIALARGGTSRKSNLVTACKKCNSSKKYLLPQEWKR